MLHRHKAAINRHKLSRPCQRAIDFGVNPLYKLLQTVETNSLDVFLLARKFLLTVKTKLTDVIFYVVGMESLKHRRK
jgi:hypothetical protein